MAFDLAPGDVVVVCAGEIIPADGTVIEGIAMVEESVRLYGEDGIIDPDFAARQSLPS